MSIACRTRYILAALTVVSMCASAQPEAQRLVRGVVTSPRERHWIEPWWQSQTMGCCSHVWKRDWCGGAGVGRGEVYAWLGQVRKRTGRKAEAMAAYQKALDAEPNYLWVSRVLIPVLQKTER